MAQELRQRYNNGSTTTTQTGMSRPNNNSNGANPLNLEALQGASPQQTGSVHKLQISPWFWILPAMLQNWILDFKALSWMRPHWKGRFLVLLGSYLYKFEASNTTKQQQQEPKGSPLNIQEVQVRLVVMSSSGGTSHPHDAVVARCWDRGMQPTDNNSNNKGVLICISTLRKRTYYACSNQEEAMIWVNSIREARQEALTRSMGHAPVDSYPPAWERMDRLGRSLESRKNRIRQRMEQSRMSELEMNNLTEGGPLPRGYFG